MAAKTKEGKEAHSKMMKAMWADPEKKAAISEKMRQSALKRKYSKAGYARIQEQARHMVRVRDDAKMDRSHTQTKEFREAASKRAKRRDPFEGDFDIVVLDRENDYSGVVTKEDYQEVSA